MEAHNAYSLSQELAALQAENRYLKRVKELENEIAVLRAENRCLKRTKQQKMNLLQAENRHLKRKRLENEVGALLAEKQYLKRIKQLESELVVLDTKYRCFRDMLLEDERAAVEEENCTTEWREGMLTEEEIHSLKCADDVLSAAMPYVRAGHATFFEFSPDELTATCGDFTRKVQRSDAVDMSDWLAMVERIVETPEQYCACPVLDSTDNSLILAEPLDSEAAEKLLRYFEEATETTGDLDGCEPLIGVAC